MFEKLQIIQYPDPRLRQLSKSVEVFDDRLKILTQRMFELMRLDKGVGLAAPQVGINQRVFVMNYTGQPADDRVYINPELFDITGNEEGEEGCLSLPRITALINRGQTLRIVAKDVNGNPFEQTETGYIARIWQHEFDHLNGVLITDRMGDVARMTHRKTLRELEKEYEAAHPKKKK
ncbi:MAG: peptide deformylase [Anaerolineae bacterium]|nr:peptide deformylase [Phycisphaerae bacterium]